MYTDKQVKNILEAIADTNEGLHERCPRWGTNDKTLTDTTLPELEANIVQAEAQDVREFGQCSTPEALTERASCHRTCTSTGTVQISKFDGSASWAVFRRHFEIIVEHSGWTPSDKALNKSSAHVLQSVLIEKLRRACCCAGE
jgi:hypothetical protein